MTTYNSYQEAKIANNPSDIYKLDNGKFVTGGWIEHSNYGRHAFTLCKPSDHLPSVYDFLSDGHRFVFGDAYVNESGRVFIVDENILNYNSLASYASTTCVLRAAALENQMNIDKVETQTEHQEEMSKFTVVAAKYTDVDGGIFEQADFDKTGYRKGVE